MSIDVITGHPPYRLRPRQARRVTSSDSIFGERAVVVLHNREISRRRREGNDEFVVATAAVDLDYDDSLEGLLSRQDLIAYIGAGVASVVAGLIIMFGPLSTLVLFATASLGVLILRYVVWPLLRWARELWRLRHSTGRHRAQRGAPRFCPA